MTTPIALAPLTAFTPPARDDEIHLLRLLDVILDNRLLIAAVTAFVLALGIAYGLLSTPVYEANTLFQVEESVAGGAGAAGVLGEAATLFEIRSPATAEIEILRSRLVVGQAVENLQLALKVTPKYAPFIGNWLARRATKPSEPGFFGLPGYVSGNESLVLQAFEIAPALQGERFTVAASDAGYALLGPGGEKLGEARTGEALEFVLDGHRGRIAVRSMVGRPGAEFYVVRSAELSVIEGLQRALSINEQGRQSGVIRASLQGSDPGGIARTLNEIGTQYVRQNIERKAAEAKKTLAFLDTLLPQLRRQLDASETQFNQSRNRNQTFDLSTEGKLVLEQLVSLQTSLVELQQKRKELTASFTAQYPAVQTIDAQIQRINGEIASLNARVRTMPNTEQDLLRLTRDVKVNADLYVGLLNSAQQLQLVKEGKVGNVRVVDAAVIPHVPVKPKRTQVTLLAGALGLFLGVALAFVRSSLRPGISEPSEIEKHTGLSVFASIPHSEAQKQFDADASNKKAGIHVLAQLAPTDPVVESLRSFRTALQFGLLDATNNIVLIAGPTPGIGKSFTSVNFAAVIAAADKRVLLIDADLRRGHLNRYFGLARDTGVSEVISGTVSLEGALHRNVAPNLDFLSTGALPPNPAELLMTPAMAKLLDEASEMYDLVLIDTSPVLAASDCAIIAPMVGTLFLVARAEVTSLGELQESAKRLAHSGVKVKGVVFNDVNVSRRRYGYEYGSKYSAYRYTNYKY